MKYHKNPKILDIQKIALIILKFKQIGFTIVKMHANDVVGMANSVDPDQTGPSLCPDLPV